MIRSISVVIRPLFLGIAFLPNLLAQDPQVAGQTHDCSSPKITKGGQEQKYGDSFDWKQCTPKDFLTFLQKLKSEWYTVYEIHEGWVKERDLADLFALIDSKQPCPNVNMAISSYIDMERSTIGNEAAWLISSYRIGKYPPGLNSTRPKPDKEELKKWWQSRLKESGDK